MRPNRFRWQLSAFSGSVVLLLQLIDCSQYDGKFGFIEILWAVTGTWSVEWDELVY